MNKVQTPNPREDLSNIAQIRSRCVGRFPLDARIEDWMAELFLHHGPLDAWLREYGSPLNVLATDPFCANVEAFREIAFKYEVDFEVYFARKANKCLAFVEASKLLDSGVDVASLTELEQVLAAGVAPDRIICTAAIKTDDLIECCIANDVTIAVDNLDELEAIELRAGCDQTQIDIALRIGGFQHDGRKLHSRFGFDIDESLAIVSSRRLSGTPATVRIVGLHFHLDGYAFEQRVSAINQSLRLIDELAQLGHPVKFLDIGGGVPMNYLESKTQWDGFWRALAQSLLGKREPITYLNHGLGLMAIEGRVVGQAKSYPFFQSPIGEFALAAGDEGVPAQVQVSWLDAILRSESDGITIAQAFRNRRLQLRCEPGRSVLEGCGFTAARVVYRKHHADGYWLIGLEMNHTQCRTSSADFLVDPILVPGPVPGDAEPLAGYLVGAYCTESELLCKRLLSFPQGVNKGDIVVFPNTAGYFMHFLESRSHQFPLAKNLVFDSQSEIKLDTIDQASNQGPVRTHLRPNEIQ